MTSGGYVQSSPPSARLAHEQHSRPGTKATAVSIVLRQRRGGQRRALASVDAADPPVELVPAECEANVQVDLTAVDALEEVRRSLAERDIVLHSRESSPTCPRRHVHALPVCTPSRRSSSRPSARTIRAPSSCGNRQLFVRASHCMQDARASRGPARRSRGFGRRGRRGVMLPPYAASE